MMSNFIGSFLTGSEVVRVVCQKSGSSKQESKGVPAHPLCLVSQDSSKCFHVGIPQPIRGLRNDSGRPFVESRAVANNSPANRCRILVDYLRLISTSSTIDFVRLSASATLHSSSVTDRIPPFLNCYGTVADRVFRRQPYGFGSSETTDYLGRLIL